MRAAEVKVVISDPETGEVIENFIVTTKDDCSDYKLAARIRESIERYEEVIED